MNKSNNLDLAYYSVAVGLGAVTSTYLCGSVLKTNLNIADDRNLLNLLSVLGIFSGGNLWYNKCRQIALPSTIEFLTWFQKEN